MPTNKVLYSSDGISWDSVSTNFIDNNTAGQNIWCYGDNKYLYLASDGGLANKIYYSSDLSTWTAISNNSKDNTTLGVSSGALWSIIHDGYKFICLSSGTSTGGSPIILATSTDGIAWTPVSPVVAGTSTAPNGNPYYAKFSWHFRGVTNLLYDGIDKYITDGSFREQYQAGSGYANGDNYWKCLSNDGTNWISALYEKVIVGASCYGDNKFVEIAYDSNNVLSCYIITINNDLTINYTKNPSPFSSYNDFWNGYSKQYGLDYGNGKFVATRLSGGGSQGIIAYSSDAITWTEVNYPASGNWNGVKFGNEIFIIL